MPIKKASFTKITGVGSGAIQALASRLKKVGFGINSDMHVIAVDQGADALRIEVALRREVQGTTFDSDKGNFIEDKRFEYKQHFFQLDAEKGLASTPGGKRDFKLLFDLLARCGQSGAEAVDLRVDVLAWTRALLKMYDSAQLGSVVVDDYFSEPKMLGRYSAKSVDNSIDWNFLENSGSLRSVRLGFFHDGVRRSVEARVDAVLSVTSGDEDDLDDLFNEQQKLMLTHCTVAGESPA